MLRALTESCRTKQNGHEASCPYNEPGTCRDQEKGKNREREGEREIRIIRMNHKKAQNSMGPRAALCGET